MEVHGYTQTGAIEVTIDGILMVVPDVPDNRHRQMIAEWEAEGNMIPPYVPPIPDANSIALPRREFRRALLHNGIDNAAVVSVITAISDPVEREGMIIWWEDTQLFQRHYPILVSMMGDVGLTESQADAIWAYGVSLLNGG